MSTLMEYDEEEGETVESKFSPLESKARMLKHYCVLDTRTPTHDALSIRTSDQITTRARVASQTRETPKMDLREET